MLVSCDAGLFDRCFGASKYDANKIWSRFNASDASGKNIVEYQIRNIPKKRFKEVFVLMQQYIEDEAQNKAQGMS